MARTSTVPGTAGARAVLEKDPRIYYKIFESLRLVHSEDFWGQNCALCLRSVRSKDKIMVTQHDGRVSMCSWLRTGGGDVFAEG